VKQNRHAEVKRIFLEAVELVGEQRDRFLDQQCGDDPQLREEVESLLSYHNTETVLPETVAKVKRWWRTTRTLRRSRTFMSRRHCETIKATFLPL
jgi:hypothetical protein